MKIYPFFIPHGGCPHSCRFCCQKTVSGQVQAPSPRQIAEGLDEMLPSQGDGEVAFYGGSFTLLEPALQQQYLRQVAPYISAGRVSGVRVSTRPDAVDGETAGNLVDGGVKTVELGCQSFCPDVLAACGRGHAPTDIEEAVQALRFRSLGVGLQLMPGLPQGGRKEALYSLRRALSLEPDFIRIYPTVVLRNTLLEADYYRGDYKPLGLEEAVAICAEMLWHCHRAQVPVIRLGLQATEALERNGAVVAGPYHPAFGALVRSRIWRQALSSMVALARCSEVRVHPADLSDVLGHRRDNLAYFYSRGSKPSFRSDEKIFRNHFRVGRRTFQVHEVAVFDPL